MAGTRPAMAAVAYQHTLDLVDYFPRVARAAVFADPRPLIDAEVLPLLAWEPRTLAVHLWRNDEHISLRYHALAWHRGGGYAPSFLFQVRLQQYRAQLSSLVPSLHLFWEFSCGDILILAFLLIVVALTILLGLLAFSDHLLFPAWTV